MKDISIKAAALAKEEAEKGLSKAIQEAMRVYHEATGAHIVRVSVDIIRHTSTAWAKTEDGLSGNTTFTMLTDVDIETTAGRNV
jgi:hypothetical protein